MTTKIVVENDATTAQLQDAIDGFDEVEFAAGQVFALTDQLSIKKPTKLFSNPVNKATLSQFPGKKRVAIINASNVIIHNLAFDFNSTDGWVEFAACLIFNIPPGDTQSQNAVDNVEIIGCDFIDSQGDQVHAAKDSWGIVFTNRAPSGIRNIKVIGCRMLTANRQLTAGGAGNGVNGCEIAYSFARQGQENTISVSNKFNDGTEEGEESVDILSNINIHHNVLIGNRSGGVFVGRDGNDDPNIDVSMSNVTIADNYVELRPDSNPFGRGVLIKSGTSASSTWENVSVLRNKIINNRSTSSEARIVAFEGPPETAASVTLADNKITGPNKRGMKNLTIIQSGNTRNRQPYTFTSQT